MCGLFFVVSRRISIHALREEGDRSTTSTPCSANIFLSTPSARRATSDKSSYLTVVKFLSTPSARRATRSCSGRTWRNSYFYPRPPRGGRREELKDHVSIMLFLSTPSARRATLVRGRQRRGKLISIHALREEGDLTPGRYTARENNFYPRPPRGGRPQLRSSRTSEIHFYPRPPRGGRRNSKHKSTTVYQFLSTPSARRATFIDRTLLFGLNISIHALREEGDRFRPLRFYPQAISIHALREEGDEVRFRHSARFQISIHALREEGDVRVVAVVPLVRKFLSTPSARRATICPLRLFRG